MKKILVGLSLLTACFSNSFAQDVHFSQYFTSPLTLNPALTGLTQCDLRFGANYRTQWATVSNTPYTTGTVSFDIATLKNSLPEGDALGVGMIVLYDQSGTGALTNMTTGISLAYHKSLGYYKNHTISFGVQGYIVQKKINFNKLIFENQFDPNTGLTNLPSGEVPPTGDLTYPDFNLGLMYSGKINDYATAYAGASLYHLSEPTENFLAGVGHKIHQRISAYAGSSINLNDNMLLYVSALYQSQAAATEVVLGAATGFILNPGHDEYTRNTVLYMGGWYRYDDAIIPYIGLEFTKMKIGFSYDVNTSSFAPATNGAGGVELSLIYNGCINKRDPRPHYNFTCPKF
jgi:type IX secretion system PorP/SprF family membrane protein